MKRFITAAIIVSFSFASCSSGGDDDGGSGGSSGGSAKTGIRVLNTSMDMPPVSTTTTARVGETVSTTKFAEAVGFAGLPNGDQTVTVQSVDGGTGPFKFSLSVKSGDHYEVLVYGTRQTTGVNAVLLSSDKPEILPGFAAVRVAHGVMGASGIKGSIGLVELSSTVSFGSASRYVFVPPGDTLIRLTRSADGKILANQQIHLDEGQAYTFAMSGEVDYFVLGNLLEN